MSTLTGNKISLTYKSLFKTADNDVLTATLKQMSDGLGNNSGVYLNTGGDLKTTGILEFANFKGTSTAVTINKLVNEADGISNNDNDTSLPTSAAVKDYVDTHVTTQDLDFVGDNGALGAVDLDSQSFNLLGTTNEIVTNSSGFTLQIGLPDSVTISGTYTGATFAGDLLGTINTATTATTQNAGTSNQTVATTKFVMDLDSASDLDFSGTTGTGDVNLNTQTFAVSGTANQITTAASNQGLQISLLSTGVTMPDGSVATTQSAGDNSTKLATTAYVDVLDSASDLDITDGSNTSDVNLNTQSLSILGTANEIVSTVSAQTATISLPSTINVNVTGNVTGDLTGNADTATKWQTARNLSLSGEATGTISNVDGSVAVSGAVTLTNSAVVAKVLTGLPTPAAGNIVATDTILDAFGKLQSQISTISSGLVFKGSWDADTNTPTLVSGGGEVDSGTTTSQATNRLIQTGQNFNTSVSVGNKVINQTDGTTALVTVIASNTELVLDADIMLNNEAYTIDASPFISQGEYYVVNVAGVTNLNGITDWAIGDWVIADADNRWSKLDHSQIDGGGSLNSLPVFTSSNTIGDSIVAQSGTALTITGSATTTLGLSSTGDFAVNTNKFTANATTGNVAFSGDLAINTNKFTVNATNGNTLVAGTISVASGTISVLGGNNMTLAGPATHAGISFATNSILPATAAATNDNVFDIGATTERFKNGYFGGSVNAANINCTNSSSFGSTVTIEKAQLTNQFDTSSFLRLHPSATTNTNGITNMFFGTDTANNYGVAIGGKRAGTDGTPSFVIRMLNDSITGTEVLTIDNSGNSNFAGGITGTTATFTGKVTAQSTASNTAGQFAFSTGGNDVGIREDTSGGFNIDVYKLGTGYINPLTIDSSGNSTFAGDVMPSAENLYDIGSASVRWEDIWADQVYGRSVYVDDNIYHNGDTDTYIAFAADRQTYLAGGDEFIDFREATESYITLGNSNDTDTRMQGGAGYIFIQGSNGYIGINDATPSYPFEVSANTFIGGTLETSGNLTTKVGSFQSPDASESVLMNLVANNGNNAATFRTTASGSIFEIRSQNSGTIKIDSSSVKIFRPAGLSSNPQLIISTGESGSQDYSLSTDVTSAGDFCIVKGASNVAANIIMKIVSSGITTFNGFADGDKIQWSKDNALVGSVGTFNGVPYIGYQGGAGGGIMFNGSSIEPTALGSTRTSNTNDIGSANYLWRNAYLGGGIFLGGTGTANKLDDYEEGTWTPVLTDLGGNQATLSTANGTYTKIGRQVIANYDVRLSSKGSMTGSYVHLALPFTHAATISGTGTVDKFNNMVTAFSSMAWDVTSTVTVAWLVGVEGTSATSSVYVTPAEISDTAKFKGTIIYHT